jgi:MFS family permease
MIYTTMRGTDVETSPLASTIISPAASDVLATFHSTSGTLGAFVTSIYLIGYVFGPLFIAPLSELYGRLPLYHVCNFIFFTFSIACAVANNLSALLVFRLIAGIAGSCPITIGSATIADTIPIERRGLAMVFWIAGPLLGPTVGPVGMSIPTSGKPGLTFDSWRISRTVERMEMGILVDIYSCTVHLLQHLTSC